MLSAVLFLFIVNKSKWLSKCCKVTQHLISSPLRTQAAQLIKCHRHHLATHRNVVACYLLHWYWMWWYMYIFRTSGNIKTARPLLLDICSSQSSYADMDAMWVDTCSVTSESSRDTLSCTFHWCCTSQWYMTSSIGYLCDLCFDVETFLNSRTNYLRVMPRNRQVALRYSCVWTFLGFPASPCN